MSVSKEIIVNLINLHLPLGVYYSNYSTEVDYILGLEGQYQNVAIHQAALGQLVRMASYPDHQEFLKNKIENLSKEIAAHEVEMYNKKQAWASKYGEFKTYNNKFPTPSPTHKAEWKLADCEKCNDTGIIKYGYGYGVQMYPKACDCVKGTEKLEQKIQQKLKQTALYVNADEQTAKKAKLDTEIKVSSLKQAQNEKLYDIQNSVIKTFGKDLGTKLSQALETMIKQPDSVVQSAEPENTAFPEPKGRKFR